MNRLIMKKWYHLLCLLILTSFASYGQNVYQHFSELNGMDDYNGNTNLLYRIYSYWADSNHNSDMHNNIYLLNMSTKIDSLFQIDDANYSYYTGDYSRTVTNYKFWDKDPRKFIVCGVAVETDPVGFIERFDGYSTNNLSFGNSFIGISNQNDSIIYCSTMDGRLLTSISGGKNWNIAGHFNAFSLSPYNDKVLFSSESGLLTKTTDGGFTKHVVDTIPTSGYNSNFLYYDKDTNYIYRTGYYYLQDHASNKFLVSNSSGEAYSWQIKFTSTLPIYLSVDNTVAGSVYLATGKYICHSTDYGNTYSLIQTFDRNLVGIYKKPGSSKLYAATYNTIYEIDGSTINIIKQIPLDKEIFKFDPLDIGNKWVYKGTFFVPEDQHSFVQTNEVIKDTVMANHQSYKLIQSIRIDTSTSYITLGYFYERIDSLTGKVYAWVQFPGTVHQSDDLSINLGDTIYVSRFGQNNVPTSFDSLNTKNIFGLTKENHVYNSSDNPLGYGDRYSLTKDIGMTYHSSSGDQVLTTWNLKGAIIKGVVYGDTSFTIVGVNDKLPVQPIEFRLSQNYPNPFNPTTTINYSIPKSGNVKLTVYNAISSKVATILNEYKPAGNYSVQFNASNLASGIYLYRLESGNYGTARKFILLK